MITVTYDPSAFELRIQGHAGYAGHGHDIVCAAASVLTQTLARCVADHALGLAAPPEIETADGMLVRCTPRPEYRDALSELYWFAVCGLDMLAEHYPECIRVISDPHPHTNFTERRKKDGYGND